MRKPALAWSSGALALLLGALLAVAPAGVGAQETAPTDDTSTGTTPTSLDPCQIVTSAEASALAGVTFGDGLEQSDDTMGSRTCVYGYQTLNIFEVTVAQAADADSANAAWSQEEAQAQALMQGALPPGVTLTFATNDVPALPNYDRAALGSGSVALPGHMLNFSVIYLLKGATFVTYSDLLADNPAPTTDALESEAQTVFPRLP